MPPPSKPDDALVLPLLEEELALGTRRVDTGALRVRLTTGARAARVELPPLAREEIEVERVAVERVVDAPEAVRTEGDVTIVPVHEERLVVVRRLVVVEELRLHRRRRVERPEPVGATLRRQQVEIERVPAQGAAEEPPSHPNPVERNPSMSIHLVGVFDDADDARKACDRLVAAGIDRARLHTEAGSAEVPAERRHGWRAFFAELFGTGDHEHEHDRPGEYAEAVRRGSTVLAVELDDDARVDELSGILEDSGAIDIEQRLEQWRSAGWSRHDEAAPAYTPDQVAAERARHSSAAAGEATASGEQVMPVVQEELKIGKREVGRGGVRVHRRVSETPVEEQVRLREERAVVDREKVDRPAEGAELERGFEERTVELRETAEEPVVEKRAHVVEEVRLGRQVDERVETVRDTVRRSEVDVENLEDVPASRRGDGDWIRVAGYEGPERRVSRAEWSGVERRALH